MALFLQHVADNIRWAVWKMEESQDVLLALLSDVQRVSCSQQIQRFTSERRKMEWLSVRVLLYSMLCEDKEIGYTPEGKPYLTDHSYFISISHTKGYVAVMLGSAAPVGIDIEQYGQRVHKVSDRYIRPDEHTVEGDNGDVTWSLLLHWSAKETIFKRMENADADLRKLCLSHFIPRKEGVFQVQEFATKLQRIYTVGYRICPDFVLTWTLN